MKAALNRPQTALLYFACWVPLLLLYTVAMKQESAPGWGTAVLYMASYLAPAVALGALFWFVLSPRVPWHRLRWPVLLAVECLNAVLYSGALNALVAALLWSTIGWPLVREVLGTRLVWQIAFGVQVYGLQAAVFHAVRILGDLRRKEAAAAEAETLRVRTEMSALRGQLNPHFLFNTLHSIIALLREDPRRAEEALLQFSTLLRRVLAGKRENADEVTLTEEMAFVRDYLAIERLRLGERLRVQCEIAGEALACWLPAFSVQPLVENAIAHAIAPRRDAGTLTIRAEVRGGQLVITVADDGPGADPAAVAVAAGVGLAVTRRRLQLRHGSLASLAVDTAPGRGFRVGLTLPVTHEPLLSGPP